MVAERQKIWLKVDLLELSILTEKLTELDFGIKVLSAGGNRCFSQFDLSSFT